jgi:hypothetical protein
MWRAWILSAIAAAVASFAAPAPASAADPVPTSTPTATIPAADTTSVVSLFGFNICVGPQATGKCHVTLPALPQPKAPAVAPPKRVTLMGRTLCVGGAPKHPGCDWQVPEPTHG